MKWVKIKLASNRTLRPYNLKRVDRRGFLETDGNQVLLTPHSGLTGPRKSKSYGFPQLNHLCQHLYVHDCTELEL